MLWNTGWILEIGDYVNALDTFAGRFQEFDFLTKTIWVQPIAVNRNPHNVSTPGMYRPGSAKIRRKSDDNHISPVDKNLSSQMHTLGRSMGDDQIVRCGVNQPLGFHSIGQHLS